MLESGASTMVSWLATYLGHSTVLIGSVWAFCRYLPIDALTRSTLWKISLVGGMFTATLQTGLGYEPLLGNMAFETGVEATAVTAVTAPPVEPVVIDEAHACVGCDGPLVVVESDDVTAVITPGLVVIDGADGSLVMSRDGGVRPRETGIDGQVRFR